VKERLGLTDEETAEQFRENPSLQYFLGLGEYRDQPLFDPSMMLHFRSRFAPEHQRGINERIVEQATGDKVGDAAATPKPGESEAYPKGGDDKGEGGSPPSGKLLADTTSGYSLYQKLEAIDVVN